MDFHSFMCYDLNIPEEPSRCHCCCCSGPLRRLFISSHVIDNMEKSVIILDKEGFQVKYLPWWRHQLETFPALLDFCVGNSPLNGEFPAQRPVTRSFDVFFFIYARINGWVNIGEAGDLRRHRTHYDIFVMELYRCRKMNERNVNVTLLLFKSFQHPFKGWIENSYCGSFTKTMFMQLHAYAVIKNSIYLSFIY